MTELVPLSPWAIVQTAMEKGLNADALEKIVGLYERWQRNQAAEAFANAITSFQAECPTVFKSRQAEKGKGDSKFGGYMFASFDDVMAQAGPLLAKHKIAVSFRTEQVQGALKVICRIRVGTHWEDHEFTTPIPTMAVNDTQKFGAALSYAKRYCLCAALNIVTTDQDTDAAGLMEVIGPSEIANINTLLERHERSLDAFLKWATEAAGREIESLDQLPKAIYAKAVDVLSRASRRA
jgi:hypothetical protein